MIMEVKSERSRMMIKAISDRPEINGTGLLFLALNKVSLVSDGAFGSYRHVSMGVGTCGQSS